MNSVDRVKLICKDRKIPISKLERDLGYANGYIGQLRKGVFPANRLSEIAAYLSVSIDYLMMGEETKKAPTGTGERNIIKIAGRDGTYKERCLSDEQLTMIKALIDQLPEVPEDL